MKTPPECLRLHPVPVRILCPAKRLFLLALGLVSGLLITGLSGCRKAEPESEVVHYTRTTVGLITAGTYKNHVYQVDLVDNQTYTPVNMPPGLQGLKLILPGSCYPGGVRWTIASAPVVRHLLGADFNPLTPIIRIQNFDLPFAGQPIVLEVPIQLPPGHFAMGFLIDEKTGELEGLPLQSLSANSIQVVFRGFDIAQATDLVGSYSGSTQYSGSFIIASISDSALMAAGPSFSGFNPGTDDWEFVELEKNPLQSVFPAGKALTSLWYRLHKSPKPKPPLFGAYQQIKGINQSNAMGIRVSAALEVSFTNEFALRLTPQIEKSTSDLNQIKAIAYATLICKRPHLLALAKGSDVAVFPIVSAHLREGYIRIADPLHPGQARVVEIDPVTGFIRPFSFAGSRNGPERELVRPWFAGGIAMVNLKSMLLAFNNQLSGKALYPIPHVTCSFIDLQGRSIAIPTKADSVWVQFNSDNEDLRATVYDAQGNPTQIQDAPSPVLVTGFKPGINNYFLALTIKNKSGNTWHWLDFKPFAVYKTFPVSIQHNMGWGAPDTLKHYRLEAFLQGYTGSTQGFTYNWDFGDGTKQTTMNNSLVLHRFPGSKMYTISVTIRLPNGEIVGSVKWNQWTGLRNYIVTSGIANIERLYKEAFYQAQDAGTVLSISNRETQVYVFFPGKGTGDFPLGPGTAAKAAFRKVDWYTLQETRMEVKDGTLHITRYDEPGGKIAGHFSGLCNLITPTTTTEAWIQECYFEVTRQGDR